jgi:diguanylate cyclase (GGDEF)-like protein
MGAETSPASDGRRPELLAEETPNWRHGSTPSPRATWAIRGLAPAIFVTLLAWSQLGRELVDPAVHQLVEGVLIGLAALFTLLVATRSGRANVRLERAYSEHLENLSESLRHIAYHDSLTGLYNHRYFREQFPYELERARRYGHHLSVVMLDVNHFKQVNDRYGHLMGDELLTFLGRLIAENVRSTDIAARYGGDEFAMILPETDHQAATAAASKLREAICKRRDWGGGLLEGVALDVSVGVATFPHHGASVEDLLLCADRALYTSKARPVDTSASAMGIGRRRRRLSKPA